MRRVLSYKSVVTSALVLAALSALAASPASAQQRRLERLQQQSSSSRPLYNAVPGEANPLRAQAIHDCNIAANKFSMTSFQSSQMATYEGCMADHGQIP